MGHQLLDQLSKDDEEHEDGEQLILQPLLTEVRMEEGKADKESL
jgi:hypothetical protein